MAFEVPAGDRGELTAAARFARRQPEPEPEPEPEVETAPAPGRTVPLRVVLDFASGAFITAGFALGVIAAWIAGGEVPGLATLGGALIALGFLLNG